MEVVKLVCLLPGSHLRNHQLECGISGLGPQRLFHSIHPLPYSRSVAGTRPLRCHENQHHDNQECNNAKLFQDHPLENKTASSVQAPVHSNISRLNFAFPFAYFAYFAV
jgi:hypothetical protein